MRNCLGNVAQYISQRTFFAVKGIAQMLRIGTLLSQGIYVPYHLGQPKETLANVAQDISSETFIVYWEGLTINQVCRRTTQIISYIHPGYIWQ